MSAGSSMKINQPVVMSAGSSMKITNFVKILRKKIAAAF
jgi:hypothetical protein